MFDDGNFTPDNNFSTWRIVCNFIKMDYLSMREMSTMIIEKNGNFFYLYDESDKINDVIKMPSYIKEDWVIYNKKDINLSVVDTLVKEYSNFGKTYQHDDRVEDLLSELKTIRRDVLLKKIL